jgi:hypothetical protein
MKDEVAAMYFFVGIPWSRDQWRSIMGKAGILSSLRAVDPSILHVPRVGRLGPTLGNIAKKPYAEAFIP